MSIAQARPDAVVLAADTLVALENEVICKPVDLDEATQMLRRLSGRTHEVCSAVLIYHQTSGRSAVFHDIFRVRFRPLNCAMIDKYVAKADPDRKSTRLNSSHSQKSYAAFCFRKKKIKLWS